jgi:hypothetical protein
MASYSSTPSFHSSEFLSSPAPSEGFIFTTDNNGDGLGGSIATGDIDGDGLQDIALSAPGAGTNGAVYVIFSAGNPDFSAISTNLDVLVTAGIAAKIIGTDGTLGEGDQAIAIGNVAGDPRADLVIGNQDALSEGAHVIFGSTITPGAIISTDALDGFNGLSIIREQVGDGLGAAVAVGNFNGEGNDDILFGAGGLDIGGLSDAGAAYLIDSGASITFTGDDFVLGASEQDFIGASANDGLGLSVANVGDIDGDGVVDLGLTTLVQETFVF